MIQMSKIIFFLLLSYVISGQEIMTIEKAISIGLNNNYGIQIADKNIEIAEQNNTWARAGKTPTVDLVGSFTNNLVNDNNPASFIQGVYYSGSLSAGLNANWVVYNGGRIKINKEQLELAIDQQQLNKLTDINELFRNIYQQYYEVIFQKEQLEVLRQVARLSQDRLSYEETKKEFGASNSYNLIQFESAIIADSNAIVTQKQLIETAKRTLYNTLDIAEYKNYTFEERLSIVPEEIEGSKLKELMSEENYTLKSLQMIASVNRLNTGLAKASRKPTISISGGITFAENGFKIFSDNPNSGDPFPFLLANRLSGNLNANLSYNLYDGGVRKDDIQSAQLQEEVDQLNIIQAKAELNNQLDILIANYKNQLEVLTLTDQQIQIANRNLEITEERFKSGQVSSLDYRNVQNIYLNAAFAKVGSIYGLLITKSEIDFLVGLYADN